MAGNANLGSPVTLALLCACLIALLLIGGPASAGGSGVSVRPGHPRLLVTPDDLPRLREQLAAYPQEWERVRDAALWPSGDPGYGDGRAIRTASLAYLLTGEEKYLQSVVAKAENIARNHHMDTYATPEALFGLALAYDWCYQGLTQAQREEIAGALLRMAEHCDTKIWRHSDFSNHFLLEKVWPFTYAGLALVGDSSDPRVADYLQRADQLIHEHMLPAANYMAGATGGQFEGYGYDSWGYARPLAYTLEAWRTATGEDLFPQCTAARSFALWFTYGRRPDNRMEHFDDVELGLTWNQEDNYAYLFARHYRDGLAQWMGDQMPRRYSQFLWPILLWRDPALAPRAPDDLPLARRFDPLGWVLMRSSWGEDATFASFQCGPFLAGHQHLDNNAFTIYKQGLLAIDPGINAYGERVDDKYRANYYSRTIAHNTITVYDPTEIFADGPWAAGDSGGANDGGQMRVRGAERVQEVLSGDRFDVGRLTAYSHGDLYTYAVGDATKSYNRAKLRAFVRHFLYLPPDLFVILDVVESADSSFRKTWLLHTVNEPAVTGNIAALTEGPGRLTVRTVLPENAVITKVGGRGKECWVDGRNWPSLEKAEWPPEAGSWRLEVSPSRPAKQDLFLHVLQAGGNEIAVPDAISLSMQTDGVGIRVRAQGREYEVTLSTRAASAHLRIVEQGRAVLDQDL